MVVLTCSPKLVEIVVVVVVAVVVVDVFLPERSARSCSLILTYVMTLLNSKRTAARQNLPTL
eukprot:6465619-Amphidinium_carterae.1